MYVAGDPSVGARRADRASAARCRRAARARSTTTTTATSTPQMARTADAAGAGRADLAARGAGLRARAAGAVVRRCWRRRSTCSAPSLALAGFLGYVLVYTMWLKRRTPQNIVIGGAAGAVPPLVGWAAVTGRVDPAALYLFAIVFYWTPPHFWALSLLMKDEYARVGVPMMPVVHGEAETRRQILLYTCLLVVLTLLPVVFGFFGAIYAVVAVGARRRRSCTLRGPPAAPRRPPQRAAHLPVLARLPRAAVRARWCWTPACRLAAHGSHASRAATSAPPIIAGDHRPAHVRADLRRRPASTPR